MEQIKLQCLCSVEPKDANGTSKIKTKLGKLASKCGLLVNKYIAQKFIIISINSHVNDKQLNNKKLIRNIPLMQM